MSDKKTTVDDLKTKVKKFVKDRDWEQFHSPKNLAMSIAIEAAELMEKFQWGTIEESKKLTTMKKDKREIEDELADIVIYCLDFCDLYNIDLSGAITKKLNHNKKKYPVDKVKGNIHKYTHYNKIS
ncbi:MAG: nucleotide pyrophosphohydrolase [Candidatus Omnitrophica bacterium]|nr:nucleotide pyrophosphohydrolase [Candidatus Omnitrophota bacterium]